MELFPKQLVQIVWFYRLETPEPSGGTMNNEMVLILLVEIIFCGADAFNLHAGIELSRLQIKLNIVDGYSPSIG